MKLETKQKITVFIFDHPPMKNIDKWLSKYLEYSEGWDGALAGSHYASVTLPLFKHFRITFTGTEMTNKEIAEAR